MTTLATILAVVVDPKFLDINLGNIITWCVMLIGLGGAWQKLKAHQENMQSHLTRQDAAIRELKTEQDDAVEKLKVATTLVKETMIRAEERLENYHQRIRRLEAMQATMDRIDICVRAIGNKMRLATPLDDKDSPYR